MPERRRGTGRAASGARRGDAGEEALGANDEGTAPRAFWSGVLTFGLVAVPVAFLPANRPRGVAMRMLAPDGTPLRRRYWCPEDEAFVDGDELVRGYEIGPGEYVVVTDEELEALAPEKTREIDLQRFVPRTAVDPVWFERAYFLAPSGPSNKAYRLLADAMEAAGHVAIGTFVLRSKEHVVAILAENGILRAETMRFAEELRTPEDVGLPERGRAVPAKARQQFEKLIRAHAAPDLDHDELEDHFAERVRALAQRKLEAGEDVVELPEAEAEEGGEIIDLMAMLRRSLEKGAAAAGAVDGSSAGHGEARPQRPRRTPKAKAARRTSGAKGAPKEPRAKKVRRGEATAGLRQRSKDELYALAQERDVPGRGSMSKAELVRALQNGT